MEPRRDSESIKHISNKYPKRIMGENPAQEAYPKSIKHMSKTYQTRITGSKLNSDSIKHISKPHHQQIENVTWGRDGKQRVLKTDQTHINNISKTYHGGRNPPRKSVQRVSNEYPKHMRNVSWRRNPHRANIPKVSTNLCINYGDDSR